MTEEQRGEIRAGVVPDQLEHQPGFVDPGWDLYADLAPEPPGWMDYLRHPGLWILLLPLLLLLGLGAWLLADAGRTPDEADLAGLLAAEQSVRARPAAPAPRPPAPGEEGGEGAFGVTTVPAGATVWLDDVEIGETPIVRHRAQTGVYFLTVRKDGYAPLDTLVYVLSTSEPPSFFFVLDRSRAESELSWGAPADAAPARHQGGGAQQTSPSRDVEESASAPIAVAPAGEERTGAAAAASEAPADEAPAGAVTVLVRPWGSIYIDGTLHRRDSDVRYTTTLPAGSYRIRAVHPTLGAREEVVQVPAGGSRQVVLDLTSSPATVDAPAGAPAGASGDASGGLPAPGLRPDADGVYPVAEQPAQLIGSVEALSRQARYPATARRFGVEGRVYVRFVVDEQGRVHSPRVTQGLGMGCDEEAVRVIRRARFEPARVAGRPVKAWQTMYVVFSLPE